MMRDPDTAKADRVSAAMLSMDKLNISELEKAYKVLETSKDREEKSKQKIENLHTEIKHLTALNE